MARYRCNACQGEFADVGADGVRYFHVCPPISRVRVFRAGAFERVPLADVRPTDQVEVRRARATVLVAVSALLEDDVRLNDDTAPRANARDETIDPAKAEAARDETGGRRRDVSPDALMRAPGAGVTPL